MNDLVQLIGGQADLCRSLVQIGLGLAMQSTLLLGGGLVAAQCLRRRGPAVGSLVYKATLVSVLLGALLAVPVGGQLAPWGAFVLPAAHEVVELTVTPESAAPGAV